MKENNFTQLFKRYNWTVDEVGENSYVAYNDIFCVAFSCYPESCDHSVASAVSYLAIDKDAIIEAWKKFNETMPHQIDIGAFAFKMYFEGNSNIMQFGPIANHDHSTWEIESWLQRICSKK